jgi:flavin reductase (DIM6/NTAB) family NADH-FMN oxidoreductase RutF
MVYTQVSFDPKDLSVQEIHGYLLSAIAPRPIAFASTVDLEGNVNLSPFSYFNVFSANPPILVFSPAKRAKDNTHKHTYHNVKQVPEVVINIVNYDMVEKVSLASTDYGTGVNEFKKAGLMEVPSEVVKPPRVGESPVSFECVVDRVIELGDEGGAGNLIICKIVRIHMNKAYMKADGTLDTRKLDLVARMGESYYCRANGDALFEIPKPVNKMAMGVDQLSPSIRNSNILTGNNIARLGGMETEPADDDIRHARQLMEVKELFLEYENQRDMIKEGLHKIAKSYIEIGKTHLAHAILKIVDHI